MTMIRHKGVRYEWTYLLDTYNNEILSSHLSSVPGDSRPYYRCLEDLIEKAKEQADPVTFHTDQGSVYSSQAFYNAHKEYNIIRSMSRAGKPTDNPIIESVNGWIKAELISEGWFRRYDSAEEMVSDYVTYYNNDRPALFEESKEMELKKYFNPILKLKKITKLMIEYSTEKNEIIKQKQNLN